MKPSDLRSKRRVGRRAGAHRKPAMLLLFRAQPAPPPVTPSSTTAAAALQPSVAARGRVAPGLRERVKNEKAGGEGTFGLEATRKMQCTHQ